MRPPTVYGASIGDDLWEVTNPSEYVAPVLAVPILVLVNGPCSFSPGSVLVGTALVVFHVEHGSRGRIAAFVLLTLPPSMLVDLWCYSWRLIQLRSTTPLRCRKPRNCLPEVEMLLGERELTITGLQRVTQAECSGERSATYGHH
jgi:hypothetical protein